MARKPDPTGAPEVLAVAPALPPISVDFNALHDAITAGKTSEEAIAAASLASSAPAEEAVEAGVTHADETAEPDGAPEDPAPSPEPPVVEDEA
ncbi:MAG: hypothetical protein JNM03_10530 [Sphingopyxis sp.]|uniref:hypothetical protein n=1 Tax=Sphingopyxis sp. TaxID=1908224 RepID=UPI001A4245EB|nr:hypothetical protein [Sphingopyxis sp.]MBL9070413.1 hypothetical protein [Sphingopyxis sp.]